MLAAHLNSHGIDAERFVGQATRDSEKGLTQKKQIEALARFREGVFRVLIATSVGEEGLDVPSTDMVIFYEAVPSEIRSIQRKGRTGRSGSGKIVVLVTKNTSDEKFRFVSQNRERAMLSGIKTLSSRKQAVLPTVQTKFDEFLEKGPKITVDDREMSSRVVEKLHDLGVLIDLQRLEFGDYAIGDRILVERKTARDFVDTLVDRDLFGQISALAGAVPRPVLIIEGGDLYGVRNIHQNAIRGALSAITIDMGVTLLRTEDAEDTATTLYVLAQREEGDRGERKAQPRKSYRSPREEQEYTLASFPNVGLRHARLLLEHFGSIKAVIEADRKDLTAVPGIGEKTADVIWDLSRRLYQR